METPKSEEKRVGKELKSNKETVTEEENANEVIAMMTGVPVQELLNKKPMKAYTNGRTSI